MAKMVNGEGIEGQSLSFAVVAWAAWLPGRDVMVSGGSSQSSGALPTSLRRRVTPIGRKALETAWTLLAGRHDMPLIVLSSRHGEYSRTFGLQVAQAETGEVSPAEFSLSVHHGLAALLSIATGNRSGHTAIAAGDDSFGYGCVEAAASLAAGTGSVLLMHFDESLPECYDPIAGASEDGLALALLLAPADKAGDRISVAFSPAFPPGGKSGALGFADLLMGATQEATASGQRMTWRWRRAA